MSSIFFSPHTNCWIDELEILTRFHKDNVAFNEVDMVEEQEEEEQDTKEDKKETLGRKSMGRGKGKTKFIKEDDFLISRQIEKVCGSGHRMAGVFCCYVKKVETVEKEEDNIYTVRPNLIKKRNIVREVSKTN